MQGNRRRDTTPEMQIRRGLHQAGLRYRVDWPLPFDHRRRADIAFTKAKVAIFVDGCFWHRCPTHYIPPKANAIYWDEKTSRNSERDAESTARLAEMGWTVLRFWEHEPVSEVVAAIVRAVAPKK